MSINMWIADATLDPIERVKEGACRLLFGAVQSAALDCGIDSIGRYSGWTNPHEQDKEEECDKKMSSSTMNHKENLYALLHSLSFVLNRQETGGNDSLLDEDIDVHDATDTVQALINVVTNPAVLDKFVSLLCAEKKSLKRRRADSDAEQDKS